MGDFLGDILVSVDKTGDKFFTVAYNSIGTQITPLLDVMLVAYLAFYGLQLIMGTSRISVAAVITRAFRMVFIIVLIKNWVYFDDIIYKWLNDTPKDLGATLLSVMHTSVDTTTAGLSRIWECANKAAGAFSTYAGFQAVLPALVGILLMAGALSFIGLALSMLLMAKVATWILIGTAPVFIACMLFEQSRGVAWAWFQQLVLYALLPLFVYVICAFLITAIEPDVKHVLDVAARQSANITLTDVRGFLLLCAAGAFVVANIHSLVRGVASGVTGGIGNIARRVWLVTGIGGTSRVVGAHTGNDLHWYGRSRFYRFDRYASPSPINQGAKEAMQNRIRNNSLPQ
ncbi:type IV secretion system protein [Brucella intermedia]|uniref:type IV secretion system protein n=1 Tax=Brucella intermedia TaxID=94625 RepID=UPI00124C0266|nr:type IV secretion system protein [Brucella intermedia]KAB2716268.1 type IV secretion system protein [Brucella intermedia]